MATTSTINEKIAHLLALASNNPSEAEAKAALLKARELMAKHKLRPEDCKKSENVRVIRELVGVECTEMTNPWAVSLSAVIAEHYCCCAYRNRYTGRKVNTIGFVGLEDDFEICKRVFLYAYDCVMSVLKRDIERNSWDEPGDYRKRCNAYGWGFVSGVKAAFTEQEKEHQEWALVLKVPKQVTQSMADMGKPSQFGKVQNEGYLAGYRARGYQDGTKFDPSTRLSGGRELAALEGRNMKCKHCGREIVRIQTMTGPAVCEAAPVTYWSVRDRDAVELLTPNGENVYGNLTGDLQKAVGIGYLPHSCNHYTIIYQGRDSWSRPVYEAPDGTLYVDVDPRKDREPDICTKQFNAFDGEPCDPVDGCFTFIPHRDTW